MHAVDSWLKREGKSRPWLANELSTTRATLSRVIAGKQWPPRGFFEQLKEITGGEVTADDFLASSATETAA